MRGFEFARKIENDVDGNELLAYPEAQLPEYQTKNSAGADFFCAEEVVIPSIWGGVIALATSGAVSFLHRFSKDIEIEAFFKPVLVHTGIKASMEEDEVLELYNRSSNPKKLGLILANSVGIVDADYYNNVSNDGEIMFSFFNFKPWSVTLKVGDRIDQGVFKKVLRPEFGLRVKDVERKGGIGSTGM